ncbi:MAG: 3-hydroxyacyl-CoA dehydrogenase family protein, partial [Planctomycetes bacterium]|nr:3-hydroxyacyl-CoA dehydrogenase family protein [Planctomycetota bacterium]
MNIQKIGVIGAGTMGCGIAQVAAQSGYEVVLKDVKEEYVKAGFAKIKERLVKRTGEGKLGILEKDRILSNIKTTTSLEECRNADLVIEAVVEKEDIKKHIFKELDTICNDETIFASNTSSISITRLAKITKRPERFAGMHFMNPAYAMKLVEVVKGMHTSDETVNIITAVAGIMGKIPVVVNDFP